MESFIAVIQQHGIPLALVIVPDQACEIGGRYGSYANYDALLVDPVRARIQAHGVPVLDLNPLFRIMVPGAEQSNYYANHNHPNHQGAQLFSHWTGDFVAAWLQTEAGNQAAATSPPPG